MRAGSASRARGEDEFGSSHSAVDPSVTDIGEPALVRASSIEIVRGSVLAGRYQVEAVIGKGGSGIVLRAFDRVAQVPVAVKILKPDLATDPRWIERFSRELRLARQIQHPNVCRVFDIGQADGHWFITMELATGGTLRDQLGGAAAGRPVAEKLADVHAVVAGLAAIHEAGIVHRDVKPDNFLRMADGRLVLSDFGLATNPADAPAVSILVGTPHYMAPEVVMGDLASPRSDVWAAAVVIHEILLGARPERSSAPRAPSVNSPNEIPRVIRNLIGVCRMALREDPGDRQADGRDLANQIVATVTSGRLFRQSVSQRRTQTLWGLTLVATLFLMAALGKWLWQPARAISGSGSLRAAEKMRVSGTPQDWTSVSRFLASFDGPIHCVALLPGHRRARVVWGSPRRVEDHDLSTGKRVADSLPLQSYEVDCPQLSPNGDQLLFTSVPPGGSPQIMRAAADGSDPQAITSGRDPLWLPNGEEFVFDADASRVGVFSLPTMRYNLLPEGSDSAKQHLYKKAVSERGDFVAVVYNNSSMDRTLELHSLPDLERTASINLPLSMRGVHFAGNSLLLKDTDGVGAIVSLDWRTSGARRIGYMPGSVVDSVVPLSNGDDLVFTQAKSSDVWIHESGTTPRQLTHDGRNYSVARSRNGDVLVARQIDNGNVVLFLYDATGKSRQVTNGPADTRPSFSHDGLTWLYSDYKRRVIVRCAGDRCTDVWRDDLLMAWPLESPDGQHIAYVSQDGTPHLNVIDRQTQRKRDLGPASFECPPVWTSANALWVFGGAGNRREWKELNVVSGQKTGRSKPAADFDTDAQSCSGDSEPVGSPFFQSARIMERETWEARTAHHLGGFEND